MDNCDTCRKMREIAELMRKHGFPVIGDDVAWLATQGVFLDYSPPPDYTPQPAPDDATEHRRHQVEPPPQPRTPEAPYRIRIRYRLLGRIRRARR